jgi:ribosomal protein S5
MHTLSRSQIGKVTGAGVLLIGGNQKGVVTFGYGAGNDAEMAMRRASVQMRKNITLVPLDEGSLVLVRGY